MRKIIVLFVTLFVSLLFGCQPAITYYTLSTRVSGSGIIVKYPDLESQVADSDVLLTAVPNEGYVFTLWSGGIVSTQNPITLTMDTNYSITATFVAESAITKYSLSAEWESYSKSNKLLNIVASTRALNIKALSNFKTRDYFNLDTSKAVRDKAILVKYKTTDNTTLAAIKSLESIGKKEVTEGTTVPFERIIIDESEYASIPSKLAYLNSLPGVEYAEEDGISKAFSNVNDEYYSYQWNFSKLNMPAAWDVTTGENDVIVAVIDTGAYFPLSDLGNTKFVQGYDFVNNVVNPFDDEGHGSHVIGTIAQSTNNGIGVAGIAPNVKIMPIKVLGSDGYGYNSDIVQGIYYAVNNGAQIINMSLGGGYSAAEEEACVYAADHGVLVIASAGNNAYSNLAYPAGYSTVVSVAAVNDLNQLAYYSNYGSGLDLVAPGGDFTRTLYNSTLNIFYPGGIVQQTFVGGDIDYYFFQGTSMAAPHVAGLAALLKSKNSSLTASEIKNILFTTAADLGVSGYDTYYGYGIIDPVKALGIPGYIVNDTVSSTIVDSIGELEKWKISAAPCTINSSIDYSSENGTLSLSLVNAAGTTVSTGTTIGNTISLSYTVTSSTKGDYYLIVKCTSD